MTRVVSDGTGRPPGQVRPRSGRAWEVLIKCSAAAMRSRLHCSCIDEVNFILLLSLGLKSFTCFCGTSGL
jgi:hypothetical protein